MAERSSGDSAANDHTKDFLFLACDGPQGRSTRRLKAVANRHVQFHAASNPARHPRRPARVQIRFRAAAAAASRESGAVTSTSDQCFARRGQPLNHGNVTSCPQCGAPPSPDRAIVQVDQHAVVRTQTLGFFVQAYETLNLKEARPRTFWTEILETDISSSLLHRSVVDAVTLAHLAQDNQSQEVTYRAREAYGRLLGLLRSAVEVAAVRRHYTDRMLLLAILAMSLLDTFPNPVHVIEKGNWTRHLAAAQTVLDVRGPVCLDFAQQVDRTIFHNVKGPSLYLGISQRRPFVRERTEWKQYFQRLAQDDIVGPQLRWQLLVGDLPQILQDVDNTVDAQGAMMVFERLDDISAKLSTTAPETVKLSKDVLQADGLLDSSIEEHCFISEDPTFRTVSRFDLAHDHNCKFTMVRCVALVADCSLLRLLVSFPGLRDQHPIENIESRVFEVAADLCRSVWYYSGFPALANAAFTAMILGLAEAIFEELGPWAAAELQRVRGCLEATQRR